MLNRLQSHVEQEEGKWSEELQALQSQLEAVTRERDALQVINLIFLVIETFVVGFSIVPFVCFVKIHRNPLCYVKS